MEVVDIDTHTARHLLKRYFLPEHYHALDVEEVGRKIAQLSRDQYNADTLRQLQRKAHFTIGIPKTGEEVTAGRIAVETWITAEELLQNQLNRTLAVLIPLAKATQYFEILTSLKGISDILAALFIADSAPRPQKAVVAKPGTRDLPRYRNFKQIEKLAGFNLRLSQSGDCVGGRRISHLGNRLLAWVLYKMVEETAKHIPEVRLKFLKRQLHRACYRKTPQGPAGLIACVPVMLQLIMSLVKHGQRYQPNIEKSMHVKALDVEYQQRRGKRNPKPKRFIVL